MASLKETLEAPIPRPLLWIGTPFLAIWLIVIFVFLGFPYSKFIPFASQALERMSGSEIRIGEIQPRLTVGGPGFSINEVSLAAEGQPPIEFDKLRIRPAWSTSWLRAEPAFVVDVASPLLLVDGTVSLGSGPGFDGAISILDLGLLPMSSNSPFALTGAVAATGKVAMIDGEPTGTVDFKATTGSASHRSIPMPLEYELIQGRIKMGGESWVSLQDLQLDGPLFSAAADGSLSRPEGNLPAPIDIGVKVEVKDGPFRMLLSGLGINLDPGGRASFNVGGTVQNPDLR
ncbi:MAG: type II secretion system protein GspN [Myxococcota bacterium]|jgi:type II secretion system protein N|nr:type II secretion system protein GspN [Myxococcota bacterium]